MRSIGIAAPCDNARLLLSKSEFLDHFKQPDWLVDGVLQRGFLYALTGKTGHFKTAVALLVTRLLTCASIERPMLGPHRVRKGRAVYCIGENMDDVIYRVIGADGGISDEPSADRVHFLPRRIDIVQAFDAIAQEVKNLGGVDLVTVDTSAAYFPGDEENSNTQLGDWARVLRSLTLLEGRPTVIALCHPRKHPESADDLIPRGGGAFIAELDGNLTLWEDDGVYVLHYNKLRGPGFEPLAFRSEPVTAPELVDTAGRQFFTVKAVPLSEAETEARKAQTTADEDLLLRMMLKYPDASIARLAELCDWKTSDGRPYKSKVQRLTDKLAKARLTTRERDGYALTAKGKRAAEQVANSTDDGRTADFGTYHTGPLS